MKTLKLEDKALAKYVEEVRKTEPLTREEEILYVRRIKKRDREALDKLVKANLKYVVTIAKAYQNQGFPLSDLVSEGNLGLLKAAIKYDDTSGIRFIAYAVWWIRQSIIYALSEDARIVKIPISIIKKKETISLFINKFEKINGRIPNILEVAEHLNWSIYEVEEVIKLTEDEISLNISQPISDAKFFDGEYADEETKRLMEWMELVDTIQVRDNEMADYELYSNGLKLEIDRALDTLSNREKEIIILYYGLGTKCPLTIEEIADKYKLTKERIRVIKEKAIRRLRQPSRSNSLRSYIG